MKKTVAIIQARMGSTRLQGKVLLPLCNITVLEHVIERVKMAKTIDHVIIATTVKPADKQIEKLVVGLKDKRVTVYRGSEEDVLGRYFEAATLSRADIIVRITSDCPLIDPEVVDLVVNKFKKGSFDYVSNVLSERTYPRGLDVRAISYKVLERLHKEAVDNEDREHVTIFIEKNPKLFKTANVKNKTDYSFHRWTLDEPRDYRLIKLLFNSLYHKKRNFVMKDVLKLFEKDASLIKINEDVVQKLAKY